MKQSASRRYLNKNSQFNTIQRTLPPDALYKGSIKRTLNQILLDQPFELLLSILDDLPRRRIYSGTKTSSVPQESKKSAL
ncbi:hypothetical protein PO124_28165 [Bacillus licheniformis]|nr:hypothetical protein [Bacillus licheniformis]